LRGNFYEYIKDILSVSLNVLKFGKFFKTIKDYFEVYLKITKFPKILIND